MSSHNDSADIAYQSLLLENFFNRFNDNDDCCPFYQLGSIIASFVSDDVSDHFVMDSGERLEAVNDDKGIMTVEDQDASSNVLKSRQLKTNVKITDKSVPLSGPLTATADKTSEVTFPSVRRLVHQFDAIVERKREGVDQPPYGVRISNIGDGDFKINVRDIKFRFESDTSDINKAKSSVYCDKNKVLLREKKRIRTNSLNEHCSFPSALLDVNRRSSCVDHMMPKNLDGNLKTLRIRPLKTFEMLSLSDSDLTRKDASIPLLPRLDSGTSDMSLEEYPVSFCSWTENNNNNNNTSNTKETKRRLSATAISPEVSSLSESVESNSLSRSYSCGLLSLSSDSSRKRSNSSDSAVEVEEETRFSFDSGGSLSHSQTSNIAQVDTECQSESPYLSKNYWKENLRLSEQDTSLNEDIKKEDVVLRDSAPYRRTHRAPSVVISDHSGHSVSFHVAYASEDFSLNKVLSSSTPELNHEFLCNRKASDCSTCSSFNSMDTGSCVWTPGVPLLGSLSERRFSDCSTCSYLTCSEDEVEVSLQRPSPPTLRKNSNWRKVRNVVQWTPFIQTYKRHKYPWVQLAGHQGNFKAGYKQGTIMKKLCKAEETAFDEIQKDVLKPFVPEYLGIVDGSDGEKYLQLQDLLSNFSSACVMDIKMGVRTYLEEELAKARHKPKLRKDMFDKMVQIDLNAPTEAEQRAKAVTKPRYMVWRETISSTATLGFRIEGIRRGDGTSSKDFKTTRTREQVMTAISGFIEGYPQAVVDYIKRLKEIKSTLEKSNFFKSHELIGSSLLFVHNDSKSGIWLIDFAKTVPLPDSVKITHTVPWVEGTHEDGYLIGFDNLVDLMECLHRNPPEPKKSKSEEESVTNDVNTSHDHCNSTVLDDTKEQRISNCNEVETLSEGVGKLSGSLSHEEVGEHTGGSPSLKTKSKNGNVTNVVERKVLNERKAN